MTPADYLRQWMEKNPWYSKGYYRKRKVFTEWNWECVFEFKNGDMLINGTFILKYTWFSVLQTLIRVYPWNVTFWLPERYTVIKWKTILQKR